MGERERSAEVQFNTASIQPIARHLVILSVKVKSLVKQHAFNSQGFPDGHHSLSKETQQLHHPVVTTVRCILSRLLACQLPAEH